MNVWADARVYVFCVAGVIFRKVVNITEQKIELAGVSIGFLGFACAVAFLTVAVSEMKGSCAGKKANLKRRAAQAALWGFFWQTILSDVEKIL